jgi:hypothetical protein
MSKLDLRGSAGHIHAAVKSQAMGTHRVCDERARRHMVQVCVRKLISTRGSEEKCKHAAV